MTSSYTAKDVAEYMARRLAAEGILDQEDAAGSIERKFGEQFLYTNDNGNPAIDPKVLAEFRKLTPNAVWERTSKSWRNRETFDTPGSRAQE